VKGSGGGDVDGSAGGAEAQACFPLFHDCTTNEECCAPYRCLTIGYKPQCQDEGPMPPDTVTIRLVLPSGPSFCGRCDGGFRVTILDAAGATVTTNGWGSCLPVCSTCVATPCPSVPCVPFKLPTNNDFLWDGTFTTTSTCGGSQQMCQQQVHARAGHYVAHLCATRGEVFSNDGGFPMTCNQEAAEACVDVPFDYPTPNAVIGMLP
jgi:hypothetical protein